MLLKVWPLIWVHYVLPYRIRKQTSMIWKRITSLHYFHKNLDRTSLLLFICDGMEFVLTLNLWEKTWYEADVNKHNSDTDSIIKLRNCKVRNLGYYFIYLILVQPTAAVWECSREWDARSDSADWGIYSTNCIYGKEAASSYEGMIKIFKAAHTPNGR